MAQSDIVGHVKDTHSIDVSTEQISSNLFENISQTFFKSVSSVFSKENINKACDENLDEIKKALELMN
jgi:hypothetical protein